MMFQFTILKAAQSSEVTWEKEFTDFLRAFSNFSVNTQVWTDDQSQLGQVILVDSQMTEKNKILSAIERRGKAVVLVIKENEQIPVEFFNGTVDDVLVWPFRLAEVLGKFKFYQQILQWEEVHHLNASFQNVLERLNEDVLLAERLQKAKFPKRFKNVKGFQVQSRYLAGLKSGGEYFDLADSSRGDRLSILLSDSSSYGLSSAILSVLMRVATKLTGGDVRSCYETVHKIYDELLLTLGEKDELSLFYGMVSRKDLTLSYLNLGQSRLFIASPQGEFKELPTHGKSINKASGLSTLEDVKIPLEPKDRLVLLSDGFMEAVGGVEKSIKVLNQYRQYESTDILTELVYRVKKHLSPEEELPPQDCTGIVLDVEPNVLRIARG